MRVGSDFSGVGAFNQALNRLGIKYEEVFACERDKYARQTFIHNYGEPKYYPHEVENRDIPKEPLDIYVSSPPCQPFSQAGRRQGKTDVRGTYFYNTYEFIKTNRPRYFIIENVLGLISEDRGLTFGEWLNMLGGKSIDYVPVLFPYEESVPYHLYWKILNSKNHGVPQNRERVFLVGIRDDKDNSFRWPINEYLKKNLKDILEDEVDQKHILSDKAVQSILFNKENQQKSFVNPTIGHTLQTPGNACGIYKGMNAVRINLDRKVKYRRLTPRECFRLMDFPDDFTWPVSDTQAYKQSANSIVVNVLYKILKRLNLDNENK